MSYIKIWIHAAWTTKNRQLIINQDVRQKLFKHIMENGLKKEILIETVGGYHNHVHCLFRLKNNMIVRFVSYQQLERHA